MIRPLLAAGRALSRRIPGFATLSHRYAPAVLGAAAKLAGRCTIDGCTFETRGTLIDLAMAGELLKGSYERHERAALAAVLDPSLPLIECGACIGVLACLANPRLTDPAAHVVIEPNPELLPVLERHRARNAAHFTVVPGAVAYGADTVPFQVVRSAVAGRVGGAGRTVTVPTVHVGDVARAHRFERFGLLCDIEGAEMDLLRHEEPVLVERAAWVVIESHRDAAGRDLGPAVTDWFAARGFRAAGRWATVQAFVNPALAAGPSAQSR